MKLNVFKLNYKFQADLDIDSLMKNVKIKEGMGFYSPFTLLSDYKFYGNYDKENNLLLRYNYFQGTKPVIVISNSDIEIKYDRVTKAAFAFTLALLLLFFVISIFIKSLELALISVAFLIAFTVLVNVIFRMYLKKILQELEEFKR